MKLIIVRHGVTRLNKRHIVQGTTDEPLSREGLKQAKQLSKRLLNKKIDVIYCSDLKRARQTIEPYLKLKKTPIHYVKELRERDFGIFEGKKVEEMRKWRIKNKVENKFTFRGHNGESFIDVKKRASKFFNKIRKAHKEHNVLFVCHGTIKVALMLTLFKKSEKTHYQKYRSYNTGMSIIDIKDDGNHKARLLNSIKHLD